MPRYVVQRKFSIGLDDMPPIGRRSRQLIEQEFPQVTWVHSHVSVDDDGNVRMFCLYEAPDEGAIHQHAEALGYHIIDGIYEVAGDVTPEDYPPVDEPDAGP
jgi:hypothetical protein